MPSVAFSPGYMLTTGAQNATEGIPYILLIVFDAMPNDFTHFDDQGRSRMVDVSSKPATERWATASGIVEMQPETLAKIQQREHAKGDVLEIARIAGIMAAKRTGDLIPLCHPLALASVEISFEFEGDARLRISATAGLVGQTGVEMEALTAVSIAALTVYDMCKAVDRGMTIEAVQLEEKRGGRSGHWVRGESE